MIQKRSSSQYRRKFRDMKPDDVCGHLFRRFFMDIHQASYAKIVPWRVVDDCVLDVVEKDSDQYLFWRQEEQLADDFTEKPLDVIG